MIVPRNRRVALIGLAIALGLALAGWGAARAVDEWRFSNELDQAASEMSSGRLEAARDRLAEISGAGRDAIRSSIGSASASRPSATSTLRSKPGARSRPTRPCPSGLGFPGESWPWNGASSPRPRKA